MALRPTRSALGLAPFALVFAGCMPLGSQESGSDSGAVDNTDADVAQYNSVEQSLQKTATVVVPGSASPASPTSVGSQVFYYVFPQEMPTMPTVSRYDDTSHTTLNYTFYIGTTDQETPYNYSASGSLVTTVDCTGDTPVINAYDSSAASTKVGSLTLPSPAAGEIFQANTVDGDNVYYIDDGGDPVLVQWIPSGGTKTTTLLTFSKLGVSAGSAQGFTVSGNTLLLEDFQGDLWSIDIATAKATPLDNSQAATGGSSDATDFLYSTGNGVSSDLYDYSFATDKTVNVSDEIMSSSYMLNPTFNTIQDYSSGSATQNGILYYIGTGNGLYSFDLASKAITPLLLAPQDDSVEYQTPLVLDDGSIFVVGIDTQDPGPGSSTIYRVTPGG